MALVNPNIAMSYRGVEVPQQNALADYAAVQQIQSGQRQAEVSQMQMQRMRQTDAVLEQVRQAAMKNGGPGDLNEIANAYLQAPDREMQQFGIGLIQKLKERADFNEFGKKNYPDLFGGAPAAVAPAAPVNAMAPAVAPDATAAPVNAMAAPARAQQLSPSGKTRQQLEGLIYMAQGNPLYKGMAETAKLELAEMIKPPVRQVVSAGSTVLGPDNQVVFTAPAAPTAPPSMVAEYNFAKTPDGGNFKGTYQQFVTARAAAGRAPRPEAAPRTQQVTLSDGSLGIVNMDTGVITPSTVGGAAAKGKLSPFAEKTAAQKVQMGKDLNQAIFELKDAVKPGGLIDTSTGSGAGRLYDIGAGFFGQAPTGAVAVGQLAPIADLVLKMVPRFEGPQSDKDTQSYKAAAGQLADSSLPTKIRKAAANEIIRLMEARKNQFGSADMAAPAAAGVAPPAGFTPD